MSGTTWSKFFWSDWETGPALKLCSFAAQGLWMRMLCIASAHDPIGYVAVAGRALDETAIARMTGGSESEVRDLLGELDRYGVFSRDRQGRIFSRRMVQDARRAAIARKNGKKGGNPSLSKNYGNSGSDNPQDNPGLKPQEPYSNFQNNPPTPQGGRRKPKVSIPDGFPTDGLITALQAEAREAGANFDVRRFAQRFRGQCEAKDYRYADWSAAWRKWCRDEIDKAPKTAVAASQSRSSPSETDRWRSWLREFRLNGHWPNDDAGPRPGHPACRVPAALLAEFGHAPAPAANDHKPDLFAQGDAA